MKKKSRDKRWRLVADPKLQGVLCIRVAIYWVLCQLTVYGTMFGFAYLEGSKTDDLKHLMIPALISAVVLLPVVVVDMITFSNRFAGPIHNLRKRFTHYAKTGVVEEIRFRSGDYYLDLQENLNQICGQHTQSESATANSDESIQRVPHVVS